MYTFGQPKNEINSNVPLSFFTTNVNPTLECTTSQLSPCILALKSGTEPTTTNPNACAHTLPNRTGTGYLTWMNMLVG